MNVGSSWARRGAFVVRRWHIAAACAALGWGFTAPLSAQEAPALFNVSTRGHVGTGDNVLIAGFVITGNAPRTILIRVLGPTLSNFNVPGVLADPTVGLYSGSSEIAANDDWETEAASADAARNAGIAPSNARECVLVRTLAPGPYTAIVRGKNNSTGVALVEANDLDTRASTAPSLSRVLNLSTRGRVGSGDNVMIMGFIINGTEPRNILINTIAGSLAEVGLSGVLGDPTLEIYNSGGQKIAESDDWIDSPNFESIARTAASPRDPLEAAVWLTLNPGAYTAVVRGVNGAEGIAVPELYELRSLSDVRFTLTTLGERTGKLAFTTGTTAESIEIKFSGGAVATVGTGAAGTYSYVSTDNFRATLRVEASGYTIVGDLLFYRGNVAVFQGKIQKPGAANLDGGGILVFN